MLSSAGEHCNAYSSRIELDCSIIAAINVPSLRSVYDLRQMVLIEAGVVTVALIAFRVARCWYRFSPSPSPALPSTASTMLGTSSDEPLKRDKKGPIAELTTERTFPLLKERHITLSSPQLKSRVVVVGDIHGCYEELLQLLDMCRVDSDTSVILVGDLVNKGPFSAEVVRYARLNNLWSVRGNHDEALLKDIHAGGNKYPYAEALSE